MLQQKPKQSEFNSRGGFKRERPQRNGRYGDAGQKSDHFSRAHQGQKDEPSYRNGIMRD